MFIFDLFVVKVPKRFRYIGKIYWEQINYVFIRSNVRKLLIQSYFIPFIPIIVQPKAKVCKRQRDVRNFIKKVRKLKLSLYYNEVLHDLKPDNLGWFNGTLYKIDYDASYRLYNFLIEIRNKLKIIGGGIDNV